MAKTFMNPFAEKNSFMVPLPNLFRTGEFEDSDWVTTAIVTNLGLCGTFWILWLPQVTHLDFDKYKYSHIFDRK